MSILDTLRGIARRFVANHIVGDDPHPMPSRLDRWDGQYRQDGQR